MAVRAFLEWWEAGATLQLGHEGLSVQWPLVEHRLYTMQASGAAAHEPSSGGSWAPEHGLDSCGARA